MHIGSSTPPDEEDDNHRLIPQHDRKQPSPHSINAFRIEDSTSPIPSSNSKFPFQKRYLFVVFFIFIFLLFFTTRGHTLFSNAFKFDSLTNQMKESELQALHLLREQQLGLLGIWNRTLGKNQGPIQSNSSDSNSAISEAQDLSLLEDLKSLIVKQISLNREIQQVLMSPHKTGNGFESEFDLASDTMGVVNYNSCRTVDQNLSQRRTIEWKPKETKFLLAICVSGQMSNHLICLEKHMFFAALLNRVLVIPSSKVDYQYDRVLDIDHINKCVGRKVAISFEDFADIKKDHLHIDKFLCYFSHPQPCFLDDDHIQKLKSLGLSMSKPEPVWVENIQEPKKRTFQDVLSKFTFDDDVMAIGDVFFAQVEREWVMQPGGPLAHHCKTLVEPNRLILVTAHRFIQTFLGRNFIALHFRRHGFLKFCNAKKPSCFHPIPQAADCIMRVVDRANVPVIYLSTDAAESETGLLQSLVVLNGKSIPLVKRPAHNFAEKWDALLYRNNIEEDSQVEAMLDKTICAMSSVFIGASGSTFTEDILRLRKDWGSASFCDEYLCQGEEPNFVAENE